jgi:hypothetical protein
VSTDLIIPVLFLQPRSDPKPRDEPLPSFERTSLSTSRFLVFGFGGGDPVSLKERVDVVSAAFVP